MKKGISGATVVRNACEFGYPFYYSVKSIIDACDEFVISEGYSTDATMGLIQRLQDEFPGKITVFHQKWEKSAHGETIANVTNNLLTKCNYKWIYYIQADEIVHEDNLEFIRSVPYERNRYHSVSFRFTHFRPTLNYELFGGMYKVAIRMLRNYGPSFRRTFRVNWQRSRLARNLWYRIGRGYRLDPLMLFEDIFSVGDGYSFHGSTFPVLRATYLRPIAHVGYITKKKEVVQARLASHAANLYTRVPRYGELLRRAENLLNADEAGLRSLWGSQIAPYKEKAYPRLLREWAKQEGLVLTDA